jgi:hypothetical protein
MLKAIFNWFGHKNPSPESQAPAVQPEAAPYKVPEPAATTPIPLVFEAAPVARKPAAIKAVPKKAATKKPAAPAKSAAKKSPKKTT